MWSLVLFLGLLGGAFADPDFDKYLELSAKVAAAAPPLMQEDCMSLHFWKVLLWHENTKDLRQELIQRLEGTPKEVGPYAAMFHHLNCLCAKPSEVVANLTDDKTTPLCKTRTEREYVLPNITSSRISENLALAAEFFNKTQQFMEKIITAGTNEVIGKGILKESCNMTRFNGTKEHIQKFNDEFKDIVETATLLKSELDNGELVPDATNMTMLKLLMSIMKLGIFTNCLYLVGA